MGKTVMSELDNGRGSPTSQVSQDRRKLAAKELVRSFLNAMERRDLNMARGYLSPDFSMTFPGGARFDALEELVAWGARRYRNIAKSYACFDAVDNGRETIIYCSGTLHGNLLDGSEFSGIRFIDRFTVHDGKLQDQQVWNDMGEVLSSV